jgi:hypothetical protein
MDIGPTMRSDKEMERTEKCNASQFIQFENIKII